MKQRFTKYIHSICVLALLALASVVPFRLVVAEIAYNVDWPAIHLAGAFTLDVESGFGTYTSTSAHGTYGGLNGTFGTVWTIVQFNSQPSYSELTFIWDQGNTSYAASPAYVGRSSPWVRADEAWQDLIAKGTTDGVYITVVPEPEPSAAALFCAALPMLMAAQRRVLRSMS